MPHVLLDIFMSPVALAGAALLCMAGCQPNFEDSTQALVKKAELLSIVLHPPEAVVGQQVTASFLMVDEHGPLSPSYNIWLPSSPEQLSSDALQQALSEQGIAPIQLTGQRLTFTAGAPGSQSIWLCVPTDPDAEPPPIQQMDSLLEQLSSQMDGDRFKLGTRTLRITDGRPALKNPDVEGIVARVGDGAEEHPLTLVRYDEQDLAKARNAAAANPLEVPSGSDLELEVLTAASEDLRFQWVSTGGDFEGRRKRVEPWRAPEHTSVGPGQIDENLHTVWLILRGGDPRIPGGGQSWFEFYVRVVPGER